MTFLSLLYGLFLLSIIFVYWGVRQRQFRLWLLLVASLIFYGSVQLQSVPLLLASGWVNFKLGAAIGDGQELEAYKQNWQLSNQAWEAQQRKWQRRRLWLLIAGIVFNVIVLLSFKYGSLLFSPESEMASRWAQSWLNMAVGAEAVQR